MAGAKGLISDQENCTRKIFVAAFAALLYGSMFGCQADVGVQNSPIPSRTSTAAATIIPNSSAIPSPTITRVPSATPTPGPVFLLEGPPSSISYTIPLNIQYLTKNDATLFFELELPADGFLFYWPSGASPSGGKWIEINDKSTRHLIALHGLIQDEDYFAAVGLLGPGGSYYVPVFGKDSWDPIKVRPFDMQADVVRIGVIGDSGFGDRVTKNLVTQIMEYDIDLLIHTGDLVYHAEDEATPGEAYAAKYYRAFAQVLHEMPVYPVLGNHEYDKAVMWMDLPYYARAFPPLPIDPKSQIDSEIFRQYYALEIGSLQFLFLDSQAFWTGAGSDDQTNWLERRLKNNPFSATIVVFHVAPYTSGLHREDGKILRQKWLPLFEQSNVILVITGHDHNYERLQDNGITYLVSGGGSAVLYGLNERLRQSEFFASRSNFLVLTLQNDGLSVAAIDAEGMILDTLHLQFPSSIEVQ
ncbi:MAG: metallophosphoesterase [Chloroflexi bacterium]|nr:metallophosphoesterase [Chloroflexota bacterium]